MASGRPRPGGCSALDIACGADLQAVSEHELTAAFGRIGGHYWRMAHALDDRPVEPNRPRRSLSVETTFEHDLRDQRALGAALATVGGGAGGAAGADGFVGRTLTLEGALRGFPHRVAPGHASGGISRRRRDPAGRPSSCWPSGLGPDEAVRLLGLGVSTRHRATIRASWRLPLMETRSAAR